MVLAKGIEEFIHKFKNQDKLAQEKIKYYLQ